MKLYEEKRDDVENILGESTSRKGTINVNNGHIFKLLAKQYKDPRGSIIREETSNCFDAHKSADVSKPVFVGFDTDEQNNEYLAFKDYGTGMSKDFMMGDPVDGEPRFMDYGQSTKRDKEDELGFFGIGSKSPLSIKDEFFIITVVDKVKYNYIIFYDQNDMPACDLLSEVPTDEENGTEVRIMMDDSYEIEKFEKAIKEQLFYFSDVYFHNVNTSNKYNIYEFNNFVHRPDESEEQEYADICYKRVRYPIDFNLLGLERLEIPIGLNFNIGELRVTPSRESVEYQEKEINLIKEKIRLSCIEIIEKYNSQDFACDTLKELRDKQNTYLNDLPNVNALEARQYLTRNFSRDEINLSNYILNKPYLRAFEEIGLEGIKFSNFNGLIPLFLKIEGTISSGRLSRSERLKSDNDDIFRKFRFFETDKLYAIKEDEKTNTDINRAINYGELVTLNNDKSLKEIINYFYHHKIIGQFIYKEQDRKEKLDRVKKIRSIVRKAVGKCITKYSDVEPGEMPNVEGFRFISARRPKEAITISVPVGNTKSLFKENWSSIDKFKESDYKELSKIIICDDESLAYIMNHTVSINKNNRIIFIKCSKKVKQILLEEMHNTETFEDFTKHRIFSKICTAYYIQDSFQDVINIFNDDTIVKTGTYSSDSLTSGDYKHSIFSLISPSTTKMIDEVKEFIKEYTTVIPSSRFQSSMSEKHLEFIKDCKEIASNLKLLDHNILSLCEKLQSFFSDLEILDYMDYRKIYNDNKIEILVNLLKLLNKRVDDTWYKVIKKDWTMQLMEESVNKMYYLKSINKLKLVA